MLMIVTTAISPGRHPPHHELLLLLRVPLFVKEERVIVVMLSSEGWCPILMCWGCKTRTTDGTLPHRRCYTLPLPPPPLTTDPCPPWASAPTLTSYCLPQRRRCIITRQHLLLVAQHRFREEATILIIMHHRYPHRQRRLVSQHQDLVSLPSLVDHPGTIPHTYTPQA